MLEMLGTIGPMFLIILTGFAAGFVRRFRAAAPNLNGFVFYFALPTFIYTAMVTAPPIGSFPVPAFLIPVVVTGLLAVGLYYVTRSAGSASKPMAAPTSLAGSFGNVGYFGIPISIGVIGPEAGVAAGIVHMIHNALFMNGYPLVRTAVNAAATSEGAPVGFSQLWRERLWPIVKRALLLNPVFLFIALALLVVFTALEMPAFFNEPVAMLGQTAVPLALFCVGLALHPALEGVRSGGVPVTPIALGTGAKLVILPLLTWTAVLPFYDHLGPVWAGVLIVLAATPSSTTVFLFSEEYDGDGRLAAAILVLSTALSLVTLPLVAEFLL
ncbi:AEC family transporter [Nesterenkonia flava]|uniref:AEC family transporter n=1 Tax=Nesterenkonia flava TaxID=469799 RepID=A0ABU1FVT2_9MICC|nr:AEC family transporter [Nesterenkonia flava]MDR5712791.1 AEC family transporter [Nesterenkonia flava]